MSYKCGELTTKRTPPNHSVRVDGVRYNCDNAEHKDTCRYNCLGSIDTTHIQLDDQSVTLYDYSPDDTRDADYSEYTCDIPVKIILRFHGFVLTDPDTVKLSDDAVKFKLITYTEQGQTLSNEEQMSGLSGITLACNDNPLYNTDHVGTFSSFFYDIRFTPELQVVDPTGYMGMIQCLKKYNQDFLTIASIFESGTPVQQDRYNGKLNYYTLDSISREIFGKGETLESFRLSDLVPALKSKFPRRSINLHLMTCLSTDGHIEHIPSDDSGPETYNWSVNNEMSSNCNLPSCSYDPGPDVNMNNCEPGFPKSIEYREGNSIDSGSSMCQLTCNYGYTKSQPENTTTLGQCYAYTAHDGSFHSEYMSLNDETLQRVDISCLEEGAVPAPAICSPSM